jgi:hypothetical protein
MKYYVRSKYKLQITQSHVRSYVASHEFPASWWKKLVYYRVQSTSPLVPTFGEVYSIENPVSYFAYLFEFAITVNDETISYIWSSATLVLKCGHFSKQIIYVFYILKGGGGHEWRSVAPNVWRLKKCHRIKEERNVLRRVKQRKANRISNILRRYFLLNTLLKENKRKDRRGKSRKEK